MSRSVVLSLCIALAAAAVCQRADAADPPSHGVLAVLDLDVERAYVFQKFNITISVESVGVSLGRNIDLMSMPGGDVLKTGPFMELEPVRTSAYGLIKEVRRYRCEAMALRPGLIQFSPGLRVRILSRRKLFFGSAWEETPADIVMPRVTLEVLPLPEQGKPDNFSGAVGRFSAEITAEPLEAAVGDLITVTARIEGKGHLDDIIPPSLPETPGFRLYEPEKMITPNASTRAYEQVIIPLSTNAAAVPRMTFSYFDPWAGAYMEASGGPFNLVFRPQKEIAAKEPFRPDWPDTGAEAEDEPLPTRAGRLERLFAGVRSFFDKTDALTLGDAQARIAPSQRAAVSFGIERGARVRVLEEHGDWARVEFKGNSGWVPSILLEKP